MNDNAPESERWVPADFFAQNAKNEVYAKSAYTSPDLWLPVPSRAQHDDPITFEVWERRERARREAEAVIAERFDQKS